MTIDYTVDFQPLGRRVRAAEGKTLLEAARKAGVGLNAVCGGAGVCGTCKVRVVEGVVSPLNKSEQNFLDQDEIEDGYRLACQVEVHGDVLVDVPPTSITAPQRAQIEGRERAVEVYEAVEEIETDPGVRARLEELQREGFGN